MIEDSSVPVILIHDQNGISTTDWRRLGNEPNAGKIAEKLQRATVSIPQQRIHVLLKEGIIGSWRQDEFDHQFLILRVSAKYDGLCGLDWQ
jgi:hypothetical protein